MTSERLGNAALLSVERYELKNGLDNFVDEVDNKCPYTQVTSF